ncbi:MAG: sensor histidine kinase [Clostridia bacterium]
MNKKTKILLFINLVLAVFVLITQFYLLSCYSDNLSSIMSFLNILSLIAYFIISIVSFSNITRLETTSTSLEEATLYNKTLEILYDNTRAFKHDFGNIVQGIGGYINNNDMEGLKKYYSQLMEDCQRVNNLTTLSPKVINNPAIYNVMANKYHKADEKGIKINLEVFLDLNNLHMKIYEFTRILGILMDNAIEAACECENKIINVCFRKKGNMQLLIIENTYLDKDINTDNIYKKGFSTKKGNSGLGLWEVRQILKKNSNLNLHTTKKDNFFSQQFEIYIE